jgi:uncharacterized protein YbbC (DUF1343 family)
METQAASLIAVITSLVAVVSSVVAFSTKQAATYQGMVVQILKDQIATIQGEKQALITDNKEQAQTIARVAVSLDKLTDQSAQSVRLLEDVFYGRQEAQQRRRNP